MSQPAAPLVEPPHDLTLERHCLGAMSYRRANVEAVVDTGLEPGHFYAPDHARLYGTIFEHWVNDWALDRVYDAPQVSRPDLYAVELIAIAERRAQFFAAAGIDAGVHVGWPEWWAARAEHPTERGIEAGPYPDNLYYAVRDALLDRDPGPQPIPTGPTALQHEKAARRVLDLCAEGTVQDRHEEAVSRVQAQLRKGLIDGDRAGHLNYALERLARLDDPTLKGSDIRTWTMAVQRSKPT